MTEVHPRREAQERFGEASLGEAQSSDPPPDPEMIEGEQAEGENEPEQSRGDRKDSRTESS